MVYDDDTGQRPYRPISSRDRTLIPVPPPTDAIAQKILDMTKRYPNWGPKQIRAKFRRTQQDVSLDVIRTVLAALASQENQVP